MKVIIRDTVLNDLSAELHLVGVVNSNLDINNMIRADYETVKAGKIQRHLTFFPDYTGAEFEFSNGNVIWSVVNAPTGTPIRTALVSYTE